MVEKDALNQARALQPVASPGPLFNAGYDVNAGPAGPTDAMTQTAFGATIPVNNDLISPTTRNSAAAQSQPSDMTTALAKLSPDQTAEILLHTNNQDIQTFISSLPQQEQKPIVTAMSGTEVVAGSGIKGISDAQVSNALAGLPHADVVQALSQIPTADLQSAFQELSTPVTKQTLDLLAANRKSGQDGHTATSDKTATGGNAPADTTDDNGWVKYAAGALLLGGGAVAWSKLKKSTKPLAGDAKVAAKSVVPQAAEVAKPAVETFATPKAFTEGPFQGGTLTELSTAKDGTMIGKNAEGIFGADAKAFTEGPLAGAKLTELTAFKNGAMIGKNAEGIFGAETKAFTEGPFAGAKLTELAVTPKGVLMGANPEGLFGKGTATELQIFPKAVTFEQGPLAGAEFTRYATTPPEAVIDGHIIGGESVVENAGGVFNNFRGTGSGTTISKLSLRPNGFIYENPAGLEGVGTRTMAVKYGEPFAVQGGAFDGMKLTNWSAIPAAEDGKHLVTVLNRGGLLGEGTDISKAATIGTDELQVLLKGTTARAEAFAAKSAADLALKEAALKAGTIVAGDGAGVIEKVVAGAVEASVVAKAAV